MRVSQVVSVLAGAAALVTMAAVPATAATSGAAALGKMGVDTAKLAPGWTYSGDKVSWDNGNTELILSPASAGDCTNDYVCVWEKDNFTGRRLQFHDAGLRNLTDYGFNDKASGWYNRRGVDARWYYDINGGGTSRCIQSGARSAKLGGDNDKMSSLRIYSSDSAC
ncbi:peptidase inhibitor family I36 protein [Amycolatopsis sp. H20-H5]|uniref:peptidase inhibitor family I36 protein n=1 Tax=Amycolatopsis sp. H20-H5 TaxID=3046309 RepID=UPI002DBF08ED|nr:peptidase inhibitor family I36 protein [Amycolatopsis sp. H20-H5]MEC3976757.1 peptidase inhibitor family I36 protein [Amycolatopsis sp. H20-H5]